MLDRQSSLQTPPEPLPLDPNIKTAPKPAVVTAGSVQLERIVSSPECAAATPQCCSALQSFLAGRCHCWQGFEQLVLARFDALQASCASSSQV